MRKAAQKQAKQAFWVVVVKYGFSQNEEDLQCPKKTTSKRECKNFERKGIKVKKIDLYAI